MSGCHFCHQAHPLDDEGMRGCPVLSEKRRLAAVGTSGGDGMMRYAMTTMENALVPAAAPSEPTPPPPPPRFPRNAPRKVRRAAGKQIIAHKLREKFGPPKFEPPALATERCRHCDLGVPLAKEPPGMHLKPGSQRLLLCLKRSAIEERKAWMDVGPTTKTVELTGISATAEIGQVAPTVEREAEDLGDGGSSPSLPTTDHLPPFPERDWAKERQKIANRLRPRKHLLGVKEIMQVCENALRTSGREMHEDELLKIVQGVEELAMHGLMADLIIRQEIGVAWDPKGEEIVMRARESDGQEIEID